MTAAAIYLRSSKDRHDLSLDAQRRALHQHAADQGLAIVAEYADAVESGKDDDRPGFQQLLAALKDRARGWEAVLALDTSRIARRRHLALIFEHEAEKAGVAVRYRSVPDTDPITGMLLRSILQAMDEWHSLTSKAKGLAGMAESVRQGWRAGGRAPRGYQLDHQPTGSLRDGQPVIRSRLIPGDDAARVAAYLQARAQGKPRGTAVAISGIDDSSLNELEWQALTYAGHTVWNMHSERSGGGAKGGRKRRARSEWQITRNTHPALITDDEAEALLTQLETRSGRRNRASDHVYMLSGLLVDSQGKPYAGEWSKGAGAYRVGKGKRISAALIERAVLDTVFADLGAPETAALIAERMRAQSAPQGKPRDLSALKRRLKTLESKIARLVELIAEDADAAPAYRRSVAQLERDRQAVADELDDAERSSEQADLIALWSAADVQRLLGTLRESLDADREQGHARKLRDTLAALIERIEYDAETRKAVIHYRLTGVNVASPRGFGVAPACKWERPLVVARR